MFCRFKQFSLRALFFAATAAALTLAWFSPYPYSITEYWPGGTLRARCTVRNGLNGEILAYGQQIVWCKNGQVQYDVDVWDVPYKSAQWRMQMDLDGVEIANRLWPKNDPSGWEYIEASDTNR